METSGEQENTQNLRKCIELKNRLNRKKRTISDVFVHFLSPPKSSYFILNSALNSILFAIFNHLTERDIYLSFSENDYKWTDNRIENVSRINENGNFKTSNGETSIPILTLLNNISSMIGCLVAILVARYPIHKIVVLCSLSIVSSFLFSQAFLFSFLDRIAYIIIQILSKCLSILLIQSSFESALGGKFKIFAVSFCFFLNHFFCFITILLFKKNIFAETYFMFLTAALSGIYVFMCPWPVTQSILLHEVAKIREVLTVFGRKERLKNLNFRELVDDIYFSTWIPQNPIESFKFLLKIKPFFTKLIVLTLLIGIQSRLTSGDVEMIRTMIPFSPLESILIGKMSACLAAIFTFFCAHKCGRRPFLLIMACLNLLFGYKMSLIPLETVSDCFSRDVPAANHSPAVILSFIVLIMSRTGLIIVVMLITLEHIPDVHRSFIFPIVMFVDAFLTALSNATNSYLESEVHDYPSFIRPMIRYSIISTFLIAIFIDNSQITLYSTEDMPCYNLKNSENQNSEKSDFEEKFRILCEVKEMENDSFQKQEERLKKAAATEFLQYVKMRKEKKDAKDRMVDPKISEKSRRKAVKLENWRAETIDKQIKASEENMKVHDEDTQQAIRHIIENRLK